MNCSTPERRVPRAVGCGAAMTVCLVACIAVLVACGEGGEGGEAASLPVPEGDPPAVGRPNILLLSVDTLRADHLGCYGYDRETSPNIDQFASESVRFTRAYAPSPWTLPSHAAMLTGIHPFELGIRSAQAAIPKTAPLLAELLKQAGYRTAAFVDSVPRGFVGAERGFGRGFEKYEHAPHRPGLQFPYEMAATIEAAGHWLASREAGKPFFLFLHTKSVHGVAEGQGEDPRQFPYDKPEPWRSRYLTADQAKFRWGGGDIPGAERYLRYYNRRFARGQMDPTEYPTERVDALVALYDAGIRYMDEYFGRLMDRLDSLELSRETVVIVTADHGEAFLEHNFFHHIEVYNQLLHVPLIIRLPQDRKGVIVETAVELGDLMPTLLDLADQEVPGLVTGKRMPLTPAVEPRPGRGIYGYYQWGPSAFYDAYSLQLEDWKIVYHKLPGRQWQLELYDLIADPAERLPAIGKTDVAERLRARLKDRMASPPISGIEIELDEPTLKRLEALGYF